MSNYPTNNDPDPLEDFEQAHTLTSPCKACGRSGADFLEWDPTNSFILKATYFRPNLPIEKKLELNTGKLTAKKFLQEFLARGPRTVKDIVANAPCKYLMLHHAKHQLGIISERIDGVMHWRFTDK